MGAVTDAAREDFDIRDPRVEITSRRVPLCEYTLECRFPCDVVDGRVEHREVCPRMGEGGFSDHPRLLVLCSAQTKLFPVLSPARLACSAASDIDVGVAYGFISSRGVGVGPLDAGRRGRTESSVIVCWDAMLFGFLL